MEFRLEGIVETGFGMAASSLAPIQDVIRQRSGLDLVEGTLNVRLEEPYIVIPDIVFEGAHHGHHESLLLQHCRIGDAPGLIVRTSTQAAGDSHPLEVIEIMCVERLRTTRGLADGDRVIIEVARRV